MGGSTVYCSYLQVASLASVTTPNCGRRIKSGPKHSSVQTSGQAYDGLLVWSLTVLLQVVALLTASVSLIALTHQQPSAIALGLSYTSTKVTEYGVLLLETQPE